MAQKSTRMFALALILSLCSCASLPSAGPMTSDVVDGTASGGINYIVVPVTQPVSQFLAFRPPTSFVKIFGEGTPPSSAVDIGDVLTVTIWEAGGGGLFTTATMPGQIIPTTRGATIAELVIARDGKISIPFLGRIAVAGMEPAEIEEKIVAGLAGKTVDPQALVVVARNISNSVTVGGEIASGARIPLSVKGDKILDAIAAVGGIRILTVDATIQLTRGERTVDVPCNVLLDNPHENIYLLGGDILTVIREPRSFTAFGALTSNAQIQFQTKSMTLDEAMAKAGGLNDFRADPAGVFVFRYEPPSLARQISSDNGPYSDATLVPIVYWLDFHDAGAYFLARQFLIQDKDIIYVANARMTELQKFFTAIGAALTPATTSVALGAALTRP